MTQMRTLPPAAQVDEAGRSVLVDGGPGRGLVALPLRRRDALLARLHSADLDHRLAAGEPPEHDRLLAARAARLTSPRARYRLARDWDELVARVGRPQSVGPHVPVARRRIAAAHAEIRLVTDALRAGRPTSARGVALAMTLLTSADSPVYRRSHRSELAEALVDAVTRM